MWLAREVARHTLIDFNDPSQHLFSSELERLKGKRVLELRKLINASAPKYKEMKKRQYSMAVGQ